jgi:hypothetical protein
VNPRWHYITQIVNGQRRVVGDNRLGHTFLIAAPQRPPNQVFALGRREVTQPEEATLNLEPIAA